jgi:NAD(P)H-hydrate epimerase
MILSDQTSTQPCLMTAEDFARLPSSIYLAKDVRELDRFAIEECRVDGFDLMSKAARFAFHTLIESWPESDSLVVLCGSGNNAGDGYIMASLAFKRGMQVNVLYASPPEKLKGDALKAFQQCQELAVPCQAYNTEQFLKLITPKECIIVDALLGTGLNTTVGGIYAEIIETTNSQARSVFAVDIPSGLCANSGQQMGIAIRAQVTATFIGLKLGLFTGEGREYAGKICYSDLGLPENILHHQEPAAKRLDLSHLLANVEPRQRTAHKGHCGHVMIIGGNTGYGGAVMLASKAAARIGAGLISVITQPEHRTPLLASTPEVMVHCPESLTDIQVLLSKANVIVIGPGLGINAWSQKMLYAALSSQKPLVLDADALNLISENSHFRTMLETLEHTIKDTYVFTPHPGEAARLLETDTKTIQYNRLESLQILRKKLGGNIVLKGSGSLIMTHQNQISVCPYGNPGMASGGMGDVLSGIIGSLIAQGFDAGFALELSVALHARAADISTEQDGERGLLASDLIPVARSLLNSKCQKFI